MTRRKKKVMSTFTYGIEVVQYDDGSFESFRTTPDEEVDAVMMDHVLENVLEDITEFCGEEVPATKKEKVAEAVGSEESKYAAPARGR